MLRRWWSFAGLTSLAASLVLIMSVVGAVPVAAAQGRCKAQPTLATTPNPKTATVGEMLNDIARLSGGSSPTGTIKFTLQTPANVVAHTETVSVHGNGQYSTAQGRVADAPGVWHWHAQYSGDEANLPAGNKRGREMVYVTKVQPSISTLPNPTSGTVGVTLNDSATLGGGYNPTGTITFTLYDPSAKAVHSEKVGVEGNGLYSTSTGHVAGVAGTWHWRAAYSGDANNRAVASRAADEPVAVTEHEQAQPSISTTPKPATALFGATLKDSATLGGGDNPTGTITFTLYNPSNGVAHTETVDVNGNGTYTTPTGHVANMSGTWHWKAEYSGDANNHPVASKAADEAVTVKPTGGVLAATGSTPPAEVLGLLLVGFGALAMMTSAAAWRRRESG